MVCSRGGETRSGFCRYGVPHAVAEVCAKYLKLLISYVGIDERRTKGISTQKLNLAVFDRLELGSSVAEDISNQGQFI